MRIVCEGDEWDVKRFIEALRIEGDPLIRVSDIAVAYEPPIGEFKYFEIKRGSSEEETAERLDLAARHLRSLVSVVSGMNENLGGEIDAIKEDTSAMLEKQDKTIEILEDVRVDTGEKKSVISSSILFVPINQIILAKMKFLYNNNWL